MQTTSNKVIQLTRVSKTEFLEFINSVVPKSNVSYKQAVSGSGKLIAEHAAVKYSTYRQAMAGNISNPLKLAKILHAIKVFLDGEILQYTKMGKK